MADEGGVWRTISGRRVFIKEGQSLTEAMTESGKFSKLEGRIGFDAETIHKAIQTAVADDPNLRFYGLRGDNKDYKNNVYLPLSENMMEDSPDYGKKLDGTSAIGLDITKNTSAENIADELEGAKKLFEKYGGVYRHMSIVAGYDHAYGDDEGEVILDTSGKRRRGARIIARLT